VEDEKCRDSRRRRPVAARAALARGGGGGGNDGVLLEIFPRRNNKVVLFICLCSLSVYILCITVLIPNMRFRGKYNYTCVPCISIITTAEGERGRSRETLNLGFQNHDLASNIS
jgi:hypothetical protein